MKRTIALLTLALSMSVSRPTVGSAAEAICYTCPVTGGGEELLTAFDGIDGEPECEEVEKGKGGGYEKCRIIYQGSRVGCYPDELTACPNGGSLALETSIDGYLKNFEFSSTQGVALEEHGESIRRRCDGVVIGRVLSSAEAAAVSMQTRTISI
jgi:hypothetical protein